MIHGIYDGLFLQSCVVIIIIFSYCGYYRYNKKYLIHVNTNIKLIAQTFISLFTE